MTFSKRALPRPHEDIVDQGLGFDLETLMGRRQALRLLGLGAATAGLAACGTEEPAPRPSPSPTSAEIPGETAGPFPGDGSNGPDVLEQSGIVRQDIRSSFGGLRGTAEGVPLTLRLIVTDLAEGGAPFAGVAVYVWHCDRDGGYSMYSRQVAGENYLRGVQIADEAGKVSFTSIFPGCYSGRWPHVHFEVYPDRESITDVRKAIATSQVALPEDVCKQVYAQPGYEASVPNLTRTSLAADNVFGDDGAAKQMGTATGDVGSGYTIELTVPIDTRTNPTGGQPFGDGRPSGVPPS